MTSLRRSLLLLAALFSVAGSSGQGAETPVGQACGSPSAGARLLNLHHVDGRPLRIVALGSSSTAGQGASRPGLGYVAQVQQMLSRAWGTGQVEVLNRGVGGDTLDMEIARSARDVYALHPDLVIVQAGTNDVFRGVAPARFEQTLGDFVRQLQERGMAVLLIDNQYLPQQADAPSYLGMVSAVRSVAQRADVPFVSRFDLGRTLVSSGMKADDLLAADHFHPNDFMHWCTARTVASTLEAAAD